MSVYTKTGDDGKTGLYTGERIEKHSLRVNTYGAVDEANSALAMARAFSEKPKVRDAIFAIQRQLPLLMADLASVGKAPNITMEHVTAMEREMDRIEAELPPLKAFIIPGSTKAGAMLDLARTTVRRAERCLCKLSEAEPVHRENRLFLNRLSDYCFLLMREEEEDGSAFGA